MFHLMPADLRLGRFLRELVAADGVADSASARFTWEGQQYRVGDFVYLLPQCARRRSVRLSPRLRCSPFASSSL